MTTTPWGDSRKLRERRLPPGPGRSREAVCANQRHRLFAALVATLAEKGYEGTRVEDLVELSGVSRKAFYEHFRDKEACFLAAVESLVEPTIEAIAAADSRPSGIEWARRVFDEFFALIVAQAAAARMCFVDIYEAGPKAVNVVERSFDAFEAFVAETLSETPDRAGMPREIVRGTMGGLQKVLHTRLYRGEESELPKLAPQLWDWGFSYLPPPQPLRRPRRRAVPAAAERDGHEPAERLLRALAAEVAEKGYPRMTVADVAARASTSPSTFYQHFEGREEAMMAALDRGSAQMLAAILPAFRRARDWPQAVRLSFEAMFSFAAMEPEYTLLGVVGVYAAGRQALEARDNIMAGLEALLIPGYELAPDTPAVAAEAIGGAIYSLIYDQVRADGAASLVQLTPMATYIALAPFLGAEEACAIANGDKRKR